MPDRATLPLQDFDLRIQDAADQLEIEPGWIAGLLALRARHARDGNRRRLFASLDAFLDAGQAPPTTPIPWRTTCGCSSAA